MDQPNILFIFSDQHRFCDLGCYGNRDIISTNFDSFAAHAVRFQNCISNSPVCVPARGSLLTGLFPLRHGAVTNDLKIRSGVTGIGRVLAQAGYHTGYTGKWHLGGIPRSRHIPPEERLGFNEWKAYNCHHNYQKAAYHDEQGILHQITGYEPAAQSDLAIDFIRRNKEKKWAFYLSWGPPHDPYFEVPEKYLSLYEDKKIRLRDNVGETTLVSSSAPLLAKNDIEKMYRGYYAHISALDEQFGRIINSLAETNQMENTVVVYTSDHGDMLGSQGFKSKQLPYDESILVPLLISWPGHTYTGTCSELISLTDLPVSILSLANLAFPGSVDGADFSRLFTDRSAAGPEAVYIFEHTACHEAARRGSREWRGIRTKKYTYARSAADEGYLLFDNDEDPFQMKNLVANPAYKAIRADCRKICSDFISRHDALLVPDDFIRHFGLKEEWNKSQAHFRLPLLEEHCNFVSSAATTIKHAT